ncbi:serine/threonine-protein kinase [Zavarzinella formosa]|uniref:serine/threonine-protein kinase n=1 Tax=Zavarzinella formosa TaxID=360055 RepID=UPI0002F44F1E|nr:serine/threonine-protein kinase [Zavarzinella formosa]
MSERSRRRRELLEEFSDLWLKPETPDVELFVARRKIIETDILLDVLEIDRSERWHRGERVRAETYLKAFPPILNHTESALVIIYGEYYLRQEIGENPSLTEYISRFPRFARRIRDQVMWHEAIDLGAPEETAHRGMPKIPGLTLHELLGQGGMSSVYRATDEDHGTTVAVKIIDAEYREDIQRLARFRRECEMLLKLNHPNIVQGFRMGEVRARPFLVMECCAGGTLGRKLNRQPLPAEETRDIINQLADALEEAHRHGIIHRDLKPSNVLLGGADAGRASSGFDRVKLADFGLAKLQGDIIGAITATQEALGTPSYMAPELAETAREADERTDVYGLGAVLYELLTGRPPFLGEHPLEVLRLVREEAVTPPGQLNPAVSPQAEAACLKCLAKKPSDRFSTVREFRVAFG